MRRMYSENQIKGMIQNSSSEVVEALKGQDISVEEISSKGIASTGAITGKTLEQSEVNYLSDFNFSNQEGVVIENIYNRFEVINNALYAIVNMKITNEGESSVSVYQISSGWKYISGISSKIVDLEGKKVSESRTGACLITAHELVTSSNPNSPTNANLNGMLYFENSPDASAATLMCRWNSPLSIPANESRWITGRLILTLL